MDVEWDERKHQTNIVKHGIDFVGAAKIFAAAEDPDAPITMAADWSDARIIWPEATEPVTLRLDKNVLTWFRQQGSGYQARSNSGLRAFIEAQKRAR